MAGMTRGKGLLEPMLADLRAQRANKLIPTNLRNGRILDIGCGSFPYFLAHTAFAEKFAIDQIPLPEQTASKEIYRVLKPEGMVILTTPAAWSDGLLKFMAQVGLVSAEEIHEHAYAYTLPLLGWYFGQAGFEMTKTKFGYFEFMLNMWATAKK